MLTLALVALCAGAAPLEDGIAIYQRLEFERAAIHFQGIALDPAAPPQLRAQAAMWAGLSLGQLGDVPGARKAFALAVSTDPQVATPPGTPPALRTILEEERALAAARAAIEAPTAPPTDPPSTAPSTAPSNAPPTDLPPPAEAAPAAEDPAAPPASTAEPGRGNSWTAIGASIAAGALLTAASAAGVYGAVRYSTSADPGVPARPALDAYGESVSAGWAAVALGGAGAVAGGVAVVLFMVE